MIEWVGGAQCRRPRPPPLLPPSLQVRAGWQACHSARVCERGFGASGYFSGLVRAQRARHAERRGRAGQGAVGAHLRCRPSAAAQARPLRPLKPSVVCERALPTLCRGARCEPDHTRQAEVHHLTLSCLIELGVRAPPPPSPRSPSCPQFSNTMRTRLIPQNECANTHAQAAAAAVHLPLPPLPPTLLQLPRPPSPCVNICCCCFCCSVCCWVLAAATAAAAVEKRMHPLGRGAPPPASPTFPNSSPLVGLPIPNPLKHPTRHLDSDSAWRSAPCIARRHIASPHQ